MTNVADLIHRKTTFQFLIFHASKTNKFSHIPFLRNYYNIFSDNCKMKERRRQTMLKGVPAILSPELLKVLCEMGHGDRICIGDGNFPGRATAQQGGCVFLRADGHGVPELLDAILQVMPLDAYVETPVMLMERMKCDLDMELPIWTRYEQIVVAHDERGAQAFGAYERFEFYRQAQRCFCIIQTSEQSQYANIILQKGIVK
jgi:L-fucose mutarotase